MKKLLFLASFVFDTGEIEYNDRQLVMVTDKDVQAFIVKKKIVNPHPTKLTDHHDAAYDVFEMWFKENFPESKLKHLICNRPIQSELFPAKETIFTGGFSGPHSCKDEFPPLVGEDYTETVAIDLTGEMKHWDFGWYDHTEKRWMLQNQDETFSFSSLFELEYAKWFAPPKPR